MTRRLVKRSKLSNRQIGQLINLFALEVPAIKAARSLTVNRHSVERIYQVIRLHLARECEKQSPFKGEVEVDESYFGGKRQGNRGRGAAGKVPVFGILRRNGKVYTRIVDDVSAQTLRKVIRGKVDPVSIIYSDKFRAYDGLVLDGYKHYRVNHDETFVDKHRYHINGIENFWGYAKTKLKRYSGIPRSQFYLYLKEMEYRFNHRHENLAILIRKLLLKNNTS